MPAPKYKLTQGLPSPRILDVGKVSRASVGTGEALAGVYTAFETAKGDIQLENNITDATIKLEELEYAQSISPSPDVEAFNNNARTIRDSYSFVSPRYTAAFNAEFAKMHGRKEIGVRKTVRSRIVDLGKSSLDENLASLRQLTARATTPQDADAFVEQGKRQIAKLVNNNILTRVEGVNAVQKFNNDVATDQVKADMRINPQETVDKLLDPEGYPALENEGTRLLLIDRAQARSNAQATQAVRASEKKEKDEEKTKKALQKSKAGEFWVRLSRGHKNPPSLDEINDSILTGRVSVADGKALQKELESDLLVSNPETVLSMNDAIRDGNPNAGVLIQNSQSLTTEAKTLLQDKFARLVTRPTEKREYDKAMDMTKAFMIKSLGPFGFGDKPRENQDLQIAIAEIDILISKGKTAWQATNEVLTQRGALKPTPPPSSIAGITESTIEDYKKQAVEQLARDDDKARYNGVVRQIERYEEGLNHYQRQAEILKTLAGSNKGK